MRTMVAQKRWPGSLNFWEKVVMGYPLAIVRIKKGASPTPFR